MGCPPYLVKSQSWLGRGVKFRTFLYVQLRLVCSAGGSPVRVKARSPIVGKSFSQGEART